MRHRLQTLPRFVAIAFNPGIGDGPPILRSNETGPLRILAECIDSRQPSAVLYEISFSYRCVVWNRCRWVCCRRPALAALTPELLDPCSLGPALDAAVIEDVIEYTQQNNANSSTEDLLKSFKFYVENDAFLD